MSSKIGSVVLYLVTDSSSLIAVRHIVIEGSSQWILGRNITRRCNIIHLDRHVLQLPCSKSEYISLIDFNRHSHVSLDRFIPQNTLSQVVSSYVSNPTEPITAPDKTSNIITDVNRFPISSEHTKHSLSSWDSVKKLVDSVNRHVCGHSTFTDMRTLLLRNGLWNDGVQHYLSRVVS